MTYVVSDVSVHSDNFNSDHLLVSFAINGKFKHQKKVNREVLIVTRKQTLMVSGVHYTMSPGTL